MQKVVWCDTFQTLSSWFGNVFLINSEFPDALGSFGVNLLSLHQHNNITEWKCQNSTETNTEIFFRKPNRDQIFRNRNQYFFPRPNSPKPILFSETKFSKTKTETSSWYQIFWSRNRNPQKYGKRPRSFKKEMSISD